MDSPTSVDAILTANHYLGKPGRYFSGARKLFIDHLPLNPQAKLIEIGCGNGDTAAYARRSGKCGWCAGIELCPEPANDAAKQLDNVLVGDLETMDLPFGPNYFDILILSEVLEHLRDPWAALKKLHPLLAPGAQVLAGSPNVAHHSVLRMLLHGRWDYEPMGLMDRTHLRWFTPNSYHKLFDDCGYDVHFVRPANRLRFKARWFNRLTLGFLQHLLHTQIFLKATRR